MTEPIRSPKDEGNQPLKQTLPIQGGHGQDYKDGWLERIFHCIKEWRYDYKEAEAIDRLTAEVKTTLEWFKSNSGFVTKMDLVKLKEEIMATVSEALAAFDTQMTTFNDAQDAAIEGLQGDVKNLNDQIAALQNSAGAITPADQAILDKIQARGQAVADKLAALDALTPPVVPTP